MNSDVPTGTLLRTLAASKPGGSFLELGTGCGLGTSWILDGMDRNSSLTSVDTDPTPQAIAREELEADTRLRLVLEDGLTFLARAQQPYDLIYADAWPGKFDGLDMALALVKRGGFYVVDDMLPQPNWPMDHAPKAAALIERLLALDGFESTWLEWSTGLIICVKSLTN
ncbi:MAG TPA: class I SAM-dependent methyltransferase [Vicinamibacterales bacterium]|jgi:predicted O-methyltransferase YrrM|nr:class I SAM-dependent methyltransferase [Vicinamibacterales bacterium]